MNKTSRNVRWFTILAVVTVLSMTVVACRLTPRFNTSPSNSTNSNAQPTLMPAQSTAAPLQLPQAVADEQGVLATLYQRINPSVVNITTYTNQNNQLTEASMGSGFVYDDQGHIVTNAHVVQDADALDVIYSDGTTVTGKVIGQDLHSDLAVVKVEQVPENALPLTLADTSTLVVGETVVAIGNPFGMDGTLTRGIISALGRNIPALTDFTIPQAIQTDAAINPGNSGGPLLNLQGEVIGVNAQIETGGTGRANTGVGFAIPANIVQLVVPDLISKGSHEWAWLGVRGGTLSTMQAQAMNLSVRNGAYLSEILQDGPAVKVGLRGSSGTAEVDSRTVEVGGDVITAIDGQKVNTFDDVLIYVTQHTSPGQSVKLTILRDGKEQQVQVTLEARPTAVN